MTQKIYQKISVAFDAWQNCIKNNNKEWESNWSDTIMNLCLNELPHGSGINMGVKFNWELSKSNKLVFDVPFQKMDPNGFYCGWEEYKVILTPSLSFGYEMKITGRDYNGLKDYLYEMFHYEFSKEYEPKDN